MATLGDRIRDARSRKGYTQAALAEAIGKSVQQVVSWETGAHKPNRNSIALLEECLGRPLEDIARQVRDCLDSLPITAPDIAKEAGVSVPTIHNLLSGRVANPQKATADRIREALATLREGHVEDEVDREDFDDSTEEFESEPPTFLAEGVLGKGGMAGKSIRNFRLFDPHDEHHLEALPTTPGVYLFYAGDNDIAIPSDMEVESIDAIRMVGTPEYVGETRNIRQRMAYWHKNHEKGEPNTWWFRKDWINLAVYVETDMALRGELETLLIKLLSPQANKQKHGIGI